MAETKNISLEGLRVFKEENDVAYAPNAAIQHNVAQNLTDAQKVRALNNMYGKVYAPEQHSGLGKVFLDKNNGVLTQAMINQANTIYVIQYDFTLDTDITIPTNCVLEFNGGSLTGSSLTGNNTFVNINQLTPVLNNIKMLGSFYAKEFPLNLYSTTKIDYLYTLLQSFSGTNFVLNTDYSVTETDNTVDGTTPHTLNLDGNGYKLTLHSFGARNMTRCSIKNITIEAQNNHVGSWHSDSFRFGLLGYTATSILEICNVTFTSDVDRLYMRNFKSINISNCLEDGTSFYVATTHCVTVKDCRVINATGGYKQINDGLTPDDEDFTIIDNCYFKNISSFGIVLSGGIKMNPSVTNCKLINVGSGTSENACINIHPKGTITIKNNYIVANVGASTLDIDASRANFFSDDTVTFVENNILRNVIDDSTIHGIALVGLRRLYLRNNDITDQKFSFWDTVDMECADNIFTYTKEPSDHYILYTKANTFTENYTYKHYYKRNTINCKLVSDYFHAEYASSTMKGDIYGIGNIWNNTDFVIRSNSINIFGDLKKYSKGYQYSKQYSEDNSYINTTFRDASGTVNKNELGLKRYSPYFNKEMRGSILGQVDNQLNPTFTCYVGNTASRPKLCLPGTAYFDTTINKMIYAQGTKAKLAVQITGPLTSTDGSLVNDECIVYMKNMIIICNRKTTTESSTSLIFEHFGKSEQDYTYYKNIGLLEVQSNWDTLTHTFSCIYVGEIGDDYGVVHSNTVNGFTTSHNLVSDGTISWVDCNGNPV